MRFLNKYKHTIALIVIGLIAYANNFGNVLFWDDYEYVINNTYIHKLSFENIVNIFTKSALAGSGHINNYYRPFLFITYLPNYLIHGVQPFGYHLVNNLIHIANGILIFLLLKTFFKNIFLAFLTSAIFLVHPMLVESVTYNPSRGLLLSAFFMLLGVWVYFRVKTKYKVFWVSSIFIIALLSMENSIVFPFILFLCALVFKNEHWSLKSVLTTLNKTWVYFVILLAYLVLRLTVLNFTGSLNLQSQPNIYNQNLDVRLFTFSHVVFKYIGLMLYPYDLHHRFTSDIHKTLFEWPVWLVPLCVLAILVMAFYFNKKGRVGDSKVLFFGTSWFFINLVPTSGIVPINAIMQENWVYLAMVGFFTSVFYFSFKILNEKILFIMTSSFVVYLVSLTWGLNVLYGNELALYENTIKYEQHALKLVNNVGNLYAKKGEFEKAEYYFNLAVERNADFPEPYSNLANYYWYRKDYRTAEKLYFKALEINPKYIGAMEKLVKMYTESGEFGKADEVKAKIKEAAN